jgi:hypothetical protein
MMEWSETEYLLDALSNCDVKLVDSIGKDKEQFGHMWFDYGTFEDWRVVFDQFLISK